MDRWLLRRIGTSSELMPLPAQQQPNSANSPSRGRLSLPATRAPYLIRHLPVSSFPELPAAMSGAARICAAA